jgi:hypothetical protein
MYLMRRVMERWTSESHAEVPWDMWCSSAAALRNRKMMVACGLAEWNLRRGVKRERHGTGPR